MVGSAATFQDSGIDRLKQLSDSLQSTGESTLGNTKPFQSQYTLRTRWSGRWKRNFSINSRTQNELANIPLGISFGGHGAVTMPLTTWQSHVGTYRIRL